MAEPEEDVKWALTTLRKRLLRYKLYQNYYDGEHRLLFATEKFLNTFGRLFQTFSDNLCLSVVDALADRLSIRGFMGTGADAANAIWTGAHMPRLSGTVHVEAGRSGDTYALVWPDRGGTVRIWPQNPAQCCIERDEEEPDVVIRGAKCWVAADGKIRLNIYRPDYILKWETRNKVPDGSLPEKDGDFVLMTREGVENPVPNTWGLVPMFHFTNNASTYGGLGRSELADVIPLQDALNKAIADMLVGMEFLALPQRWGTGVEIPEDPERPGSPAPIKTAGRAQTVAVQGGPNRMMAVASDLAKFGQFPGADLGQFLQVQDAFRLEIARVSGRPPQYMQLASISNVSDDALRTLDGRLVKTAEDRTDEYGETWLSLMNLAIRMSGDSGILESVDWDDVSTSDEMREVEIATAKLQIGVSKKQVLKEVGYDDTLIEEMLGEATASADAAEQAIIRAALAGQESAVVPPVVTEPVPSGRA